MRVPGRYSASAVGCGLGHRAEYRSNVIEVYVRYPPRKRSTARSAYGRWRPYADPGYRLRPDGGG